MDAGLALVLAACIAAGLQIGLAINRRIFAH